MKDHIFKLDFDHFQFLVGDKHEGPLVDTTKMWDLSSPIGVVHGIDYIAGISTVRMGGKLSVIVRVTEDHSQKETEWNTLGQFDIDLPSGQMILWAPETFALDDAPVVHVVPDRYHAVAYSRNTEKVNDEMSSEGPDEYCIVISPL